MQSFFHASTQGTYSWCRPCHHGIQLGCKRSSPLADCTICRRPTIHGARALRAETACAVDQYHCLRACAKSLCPESTRGSTCSTRGNLLVPTKRSKSSMLAARCEVDTTCSTLTAAVGMPSPRSGAVTRSVDQDARHGCKTLERSMADQWRRRPVSRIFSVISRDNCILGVGRFFYSVRSREIMNFTRCTRRRRRVT